MGYAHGAWNVPPPPGEPDGVAEARGIHKGAPAEDGMGTTPMKMQSHPRVAPMIEGQNL
jgi:hypothetical protein